MSVQPFWALGRIDALEAAVIAQARADAMSAGMGTSNNTMVAAECPRNFGDCDGSRADEVEMVPYAEVQPSPTMPGLLHNACVDVGGEDMEMIDGPAVLGDCGVEMVGEGRSVDAFCDEGAMRGQVASAEDGVVAVPAEAAVVGEGDAGGADGGAAGAAEVIESRIDVDRLGLSEVLATGKALVGESSCMTGGEAVDGEDGFGGAGGGDTGAAIIAAGSRADVDRPGSGLRAEAMSTADFLAWNERAKVLMQAIAEKGLQAAIRSRGAVLGQGAAPGALHVSGVSGGGGSSGWAGGWWWR